MASPYPRHSIEMASVFHGENLPASLEMEKRRVNVEFRRERRLLLNLKLLTTASAAQSVTTGPTLFGDS